MKDDEKVKSRPHAGQKKSPARALPAKRPTESQRIENGARPDQAEGKLRLTQFVVDHMSEAVFWVATGGRFVYVNEAACQFLGYSMAELLQMQIMDIAPDYTKAKWATHMRLLKQSGALVVESRYKKKSGTIFPLEVKFNSIQFEGKRYACGIAHDFSKRMRAEQALQEGEDNWRSLVMAIPDYIAVHDRDGKYLFLNHYADGFTEKDVIGQSIYDFISPESRPVFKFAMDEVQRTGKMQKFEFTGLGAHKEPKEYDEYLIPITNTRGETNIVALARDITERKQAEAALLETQDFMNNLLENAPMSIYVISADGKVILVNRAWEAQRHIQRETAIGSRQSDLFPSEMLRNFEENNRRVIDSAAPLVSEETVDDPDGRHYYHTVKFPLRDSAGLIDSVGGISMDITESRLLEDSLRESEVRYRDLVENSHELIYTHDLHGQLLSVNHIAALRLGHNPTALVGRNLGELMAPGQRPHFEDYLGRIQRKGSAEGEWVLQSITGESRFWEYHSTLRSDVRQGAYVRGMAHDITERKRAALRQEIINQVLHAAIGQLDLKVLAQSAVETIARITAYPHVCLALPEENGECWVVAGAAGRLAAEIGATYPIHQGVIGRAFKTGYRQWVRDILDDPSYVRDVSIKDAPLLRSEFVALVQRGDHFLGALNVESERVDAFDDQDVEMFQSLADVIALGVENARLYQEAQQEIAERKRAAEALRESHQLLTKSFAALQEAIFILDLNTTNVKDCNPAASHIFGYSHEEILGRTTAFLHVNDATLSEFRQALNKGIEEKGFLDQFEFRMKRKDGTIFPTEHSVIPIDDAEGKRSGWVSVVRDITDRKRAEEVSRESEERYRNLVENSLEGIGISQGNRVIFANQALVKMFGYATSEEFIQVPLLDHVAPASKPVIQERLKARKNRHPLSPHFEYKIIRKDGTIRDIEISIAETILGKTSVTQSTFRDITERKQAEEAMRESEARYRAVVEGVDDAIFVESTDARILDVNRRACEMFGYSHAEFLTKRVADLVPSNDYVITLNLRGSPTLPIHPIETVNVRANGEQFPIELNFRLQTLHGEQVLLVVGRDITERKRTEKLLLESEARFKLMFEQAPLAINITRDTDILYANPAYLMMFGYSSLAELQRLPPLELFTPESRSIIMENIRRRTQGLPVPNGYEAECIRKNGTRFPVLLHFARTDFSDGPATVGFILDITERKRAENELATSRRQLRALSQYLQAAREEERTFVAREIHDELGQALTAMKMDLAWLARQLPPEQPDLLDKTSAMSDMVDGTIQMVRRVASQLRPGMLDDLGLVAALEWQAGEFQSRTGILCKLDLPENVTTLSQDQATAMFRIFQETLTNIARHAGATRVRIALKQLQKGISLVVRDNGTGITQDQLNDPRSLGLTGMRERVQAYGGTVEFKSAPGKGTSVRVRMPVEKMQMEMEI
jgi:PAS domain S-box-containing protein